MPNSKKKATVTIPFSLLPESQNWRVGKSYRVRLVVHQISTTETGAEFEIVDAISLEEMERTGRHFVSENGMLKA